MTRPPHPQPGHSSGPGGSAAREEAGDMQAGAELGHGEGRVSCCSIPGLHRSQGCTLHRQCGPSPAPPSVWLLSVYLRHPHGPATLGPGHPTSHSGPSHRSIRWVFWSRLGRLSIRPPEVPAPPPEREGRPGLWAWSAGRRARFMRLFHSSSPRPSRGASPGRKLRHRR